MKTPEKNSVHTIFDGSNRYLAPAFQRYYVWGPDELQALLDDIENAAGPSGIQFIGATVIQDFGKKGGAQSPSEYLLIDGQQRLTTLYLLICGIAWCYLQKNKVDAAETLAQTYLSFSAGTYAGMPKLIPTLQDRKQLYAILADDVDCVGWNFSAYPADETSRRAGIERQWKRIQKHFRESFFDPRHRLISGRLRAFEQNLLHYIEMVQIILEPNDDANTAFSKLNFLGIPLSISDLVRNDVFARLSSQKPEGADKFYRDRWLPFEKSFPNDSFEQYVPIYALIRFGGNCTKAQVFPKLQKSWSKKKAEAVLRELKIYAELFAALVSYRPIPGFHKDVNAQIQRLSMMPRTTVTWPYVLQVLLAFKTNKISKRQACDALGIVETFLVRRAINGLEPTGLHAVFKGLWGKANADKKLLQAKIVTSTIRCPGDDEIVEALRTDNMYTRQITKYLLIRREITFNTQHGYDNATADFSVEHVMPRNRVGEWASEFSREEHAALVNTIGNLLPLTQRQNSNIRDGSWGKKRSALNGSNWKIAQRAARSKNWNPGQIRRRSREFAKWVVQEWPELDRV